jgi:aminopeptidase N
MKKNLLTLFLFAIFYASYSQDMPHEKFIEKLSLIEQKNAALLMKTPLVFNGDNYDLKYQRMHWNINPDTLFISGEVTSYFITTKPLVNQVSFDLSFVMNVDSIKYHTSILTFSHNTNDALIINLPSSLALNQVDSISIFYHGNPPGSGFGSFIKDVHNGTHIIWTLSEPFGAKEWWPCKNDLSDKVDSVDIYISTPQQFRSASNGMLVSETIQDTIKTAHWKHKYPIATYLVALAVTNYQSFSVYAQHGIDSIQILNYVYPEELANAQTYAQDIINPMKLFDSLFITYPFVNERYGMTQFNWGGGMEHQTMTFLHDFGYEIMTHELAHQWVGDMITCANWHDIWLNEGFATYWTGLSYNFFSYDLYWQIWKRMQIANITSQPDGAVYCNDTTNVSRIFDGRLSYAKGGMILHMLRWIIGDSSFFAGFRSYLSDTNLAYKYARSDDFITHMENASGKTLTGFFNDWLYGEGYPIYSIPCVFSAFTNDIQVTINQTQSHPSVSFFKMPVPLKFKDATHDTIIVFDNTFSGQQYSVNPGFRPDSILFDPDMWIVSANDTVMMSVEEYPPNHLFSIFPNPVTNDVNIHFSSYAFQGANLYDISGRLVRSVNTVVKQGDIKLKMSDITKGIYFIKVIFDDRAITDKLVKM